MSARSPLLDFFILEAADYVVRLRAAAEREAGPEGDDFLTAARALRGSATMARLPETARLAGAVEGLADSVRNGALPWSPASTAKIGDALSELDAAVERLRTADTEDSGRLKAALTRLGDDIPRGHPAVQSIIPISSLFFEDAGPHIVRLATKPVAQLEARLRAAARTGETPNLESVASSVARPKGRELRDLLSASIAKMGVMHRGTARKQSEIVPVDSLLYRGEAAMARAREITGSSLQSGRPPSQSALEELHDLLELAARE